MITTILATFTIGSATLGQFAPQLYRFHATNELARLLDEEYGPDGWVAHWVVSDNQSDEQIDLYRTIYLSVLYPRYLSFTPYEGLRFTHEAGWANMPPHYAVFIYATDGESSFRWSMKNDSWYLSYHNAIEILSSSDQRKIFDGLARIERVDGLNVPIRLR